MRSPSQLCIVSLALCSRHLEEVKVRTCDLKTSKLWSPRVQFNQQQPQEEKHVHRLACLLVNFSRDSPEGKQPGSCSLCRWSECKSQIIPPAQCHLGLLKRPTYYMTRSFISSRKTQGPADNSIWYHQCMALQKPPGASMSDMEDVCGWVLTCFSGATRTRHGSWEAPASFHWGKHPGIQARRNLALLVQRLYILGNVLLTYVLFSVLDILTFEHPGCIPDTANVLHDQKSSGMISVVSMYMCVCTIIVCSVYI